MTTPQAAVHLTVRDSSNVGEARRTAVAVGRANGMDDASAGAVAIVATELATNLSRYAPGGTVSIQWLATTSGDALEIIAMDHGPGIEDVSRCMSDGYSTGGTPGTGLGAVKRFSTEFDAYSLPGRGSIFVSRILRSRAAPSVRPDLQWAAFSRPVSGEVENGDAWQISVTADSARFFVVDGLGHGPVAALAANTAIGSFRKHPDHTPLQFMESAHRDMAGTRGAAAAMLRLDGRSDATSYVGVGNISSWLVGSNGQKGLISHNGTLGGAVRKFQAFEYSWLAGALLIMHSDGIKTHWSLNDYPGLATRHPAIIAATLARDFSRGRDDMTVLVARRGRTQ